MELNALLGNTASVCVQVVYVCILFSLPGNSHLLFFTDVVMPDTSRLFLSVRLFLICYSYGIMTAINSINAYPTNCNKYQ